MAWTKEKTAIALSPGPSVFIQVFGNKMSTARGDVCGVNLTRKRLTAMIKNFLKAQGLFLLHLCILSI
jgi:hypothetical protein